MITTRIQGSLGMIKVEGRFTFQDYDAFTAVTKAMLSGQWISELDLDLSEASYMDSNALSMLIALKDKAKAQNILVKLLRPSPTIRAILEMVQFDKLFPILE